MNIKIGIVVGIVVVAIIGLIVLSNNIQEPVMVTPEEVNNDSAVMNDVSTPQETDIPFTSPTITDLLVETTELSSLLDTVSAARLGAVFDTEGPFTVFAPNNTAFAAVPEETLSTLLQPENVESLQALLGLHVVSGTALSSDLSDGMTVTTLTGDELTVSITDDGTVTVGGATVITADIQATNGVVHIIDTVITEAS